MKLKFQHKFTFFPKICVGFGHIIRAFFIWMFRSQWPCDLRRWPTAARWLGLRVRIPPDSMDVCCGCCVCCQVKVSAMGRSLVQGSPTEYDVSECDRESSILLLPWPTMGAVEP